MTPVSYLAGVWTACVVVAVLANVLPAERRGAAQGKIERGCLLAAGNARVNAAWLAEGHPRRESALLLLSRDAAWAPVCAQDRKAGEALRDEILSVVGEPNAAGAQASAARLIDMLDTTGRPP